MFFQFLSKGADLIRKEKDRRDGRSFLAATVAGGPAAGGCGKLQIIENGDNLIFETLSLARRRSSDAAILLNRDHGTGRGLNTIDGGLQRPVPARRVRHGDVDLIDLIESHFGNFGKCHVGCAVVRGKKRGGKYMALWCQIRNTEPQACRARLKSKDYATADPRISKSRCRTSRVPLRFSMARAARSASDVRFPPVPRGASNSRRT